MRSRKFADEPLERDAVRYHSDIARHWEAKYQSGSFRTRTRLVVDEVMPFVRERTGLWLDAGCGSGHFSRLLAQSGNKVIGVDASEDMIEVAKELASGAEFGSSIDLRFVETIERLPFDGGSFDGAFCISVIEYVNDVSQALTELRRVLKADGLLVLSLPHRMSPVRLLQRAATRFIQPIVPAEWQYVRLSRYASSPAGLEALLKAHGFSTIKILGLSAFGNRFCSGLLPRDMLFAVARREA